MVQRSWQYDSEVNIEGGYSHQLVIYEIDNRDFRAIRNLIIEALYPICVIRVMIEIDQWGTKSIRKELLMCWMMSLRSQ